MKPAFIKWYGKQNGQERKATLRAGAKGKGKTLHTINYWPNSSLSREKTYDLFIKAADYLGYQIVDTDRNTNE